MQKDELEPGAVFVTSLKPGDVIESYRGHISRTWYKNGDKDINGYTVKLPLTYTHLAGSGSILRAADGSEIVLGGLLQCRKAAPPPIDRSKWPGTCTRCGRGTYTSAFSVEHEGGNCGG